MSSAAARGLHAAHSVSYRRTHAQVVFKTTPNVSKAEIREVLQKVYRIPVTSVHTAVYEGKKSRSGRRGTDTVKAPDYKKVWVRMAPGVLTQDVCPTLAYPQELRSAGVGKDSSGNPRLAAKSLV